MNYSIIYLNLLLFFSSTTSVSPKQFSNNNIIIKINGNPVKYKTSIDTLLYSVGPISVKIFPKSLISIDETAVVFKRKFSVAKYTPSITQDKFQKIVIKPNLLGDTLEYKFFPSNLDIMSQQYIFLTFKNIHYKGQRETIKQKEILFYYY